MYDTNSVLVSSTPKYISPYVPEYHSSGAVGVDVRADVDGAVTLRPLERLLVGTGLHIALPQHLEAQIRPRSGLAAKTGLSIVNTPGTIDPDYRGEIRVPVINLSNQDITIQPNDRIAQMVVAPFVQADFLHVEAKDLPATGRGSGGFGSTGVT